MAVFPLQEPHFVLSSLILCKVVLVILSSKCFSFLFILPSLSQCPFLLSLWWNPIVEVLTPWIPCCMLCSFILSLLCPWHNKLWGLWKKTSQDIRDEANRWAWWKCDMILEHWHRYWVVSSAVYEVNWSLIPLPIDSFYAPSTQKSHSNRKTKRYRYRGMLL